MNKTNIIIALAAVAMPAFGQNLSTEVKVDRTVVPAERSAERLGGVHPAIVAAPINAPRLNMSEYNSPGSITRSARTLAAVSWADTLRLPPYRGYLSAGYFPSYNLGVSVGYRIIHSPDTRLGVWGQFDGYSYKADEVEGNRDKISNNTFALGVDFDHRFRNVGVLNVKASTSYGSLEAPSAYLEGKHNISITDVSAAWWARAGKLGYHAGAAMHRFGFGGNKSSEAVLTAISGNGAEMQFGANAGVIAPLAGNARPRLGLEINADFLSRPAAAALGVNEYGMVVPSAADRSMLGLLSITPYYAVGTGKGVDVRLGARVDIGTGGADKKFHIAPDVMLSYNADVATVYLRATGGEVLNTQRSLYDVSPFFPAGWQYGRSHIPLNLEGGFNLGPWTGFDVEVFGGWARANDWLMPTLSSLAGGKDVSVFRSIDLKGAHAGLRAHYAYRDMVDVHASVEMAPQRENSGYYMWRDRAKMVVKTDACVRPIAALEINVGYEFRQSRAAYVYDAEGACSGKLNLGCLSNLRAGASYEITEAIGAYVCVENILGRKCLVLPGVQEQGIHGLIGVNLKF